MDTWQNLYDAHQKGVWNAVRRYCVGHGFSYQDCEDACSEAWRVTFEKFDAYEGNFPGWAYKTAVNYLRWNQRCVTVDITEDENVVPMQFASGERSKYSKRIVFRRNQPRPQSPRQRVLYDFLLQFEKDEHDTKVMRTAVQTLFLGNGYSPRFDWRKFNFLEVR